MKKQKVVRSKPTTLGIHRGKTMIHTPRPTTLDGGITQTLGGGINKIKAKIKDVTTPTTMQLTNNSHREHINTTITTPLHIHIKTKITLIILLPPIPTYHHLMTDSQGLKTCLKAYAKRFKTTRCSRRKCKQILRTRETPSRGWNLKWVSLWADFQTYRWIPKWHREKSERWNKESKMGRLQDGHYKW